MKDYPFYLFFVLNGRRLVECFDDYTMCNSRFNEIKEAGGTNIEVVWNR